MSGSRSSSSAFPAASWGFLIAVNILVFILGCFIDFFEIAFIVVPLLAPVAAKLGIDLVWFGVHAGREPADQLPHAALWLCAVLHALGGAGEGTTSTRSPAEGSPASATTQIYRGAVSFIILQVIMIAVVVAFPWIALPDSGPKVDPNSIEIEIPAIDTGGGESGGVPPPPAFD